MKILPGSCIIWKRILEKPTIFITKILIRWWNCGRCCERLSIAGGAGVKKTGDGRPKTEDGKGKAEEGKWTVSVDSRDAQLCVCWFDEN